MSFISPYLDWLFYGGNWIYYIIPINKGLFEDLMWPNDIKLKVKDVYKGGQIKNPQIWMMS